MFLDYSILDVLRLRGIDLGSLVLAGITRGYFTQLDKASVFKSGQQQTGFNRPSGD